MGGTQRARSRYQVAASLFGGILVLGVLAFVFWIVWQVNSGTGSSARNRSLDREDRAGLIGLAVLLGGTVLVVFGSAWLLSIVSDRQAILEQEIPLRAAVSRALTVSKWPSPARS